MNIVNKPLPRKGNRILKILLAAAVLAGLAVLLFAIVIPGIRKNQAEQKRIRDATALVLQSDLLTPKLSGGRSFSPVREPWIAVRRGLEETEYRVIDMSGEEELTEDGLKAMRTLIVCDGSAGKSADYARYVNGVQQGRSFSVESEAVTIRCIDLADGSVYGQDTVLGAKSLPNSNPSKGDRTYSDGEVTKAVRDIVSSRTCPGYADGAWSYDAETGTLSAADVSAFRSHSLCPLPGGIESVRALEKLPDGIRALYLPPDISFLADGVLDGVWFVVADADSYAARYAAEHGIPCMENGSSRISVPSMRGGVWSSRFGAASDALKALWEESGAKSLYIPADTAIEDGMFWLGETGLQVLVEPGSPADDFLSERLGQYRECCEYTYRQTWEKESSGFSPDRGETVVLGRFEQDGNFGNGPEPVEWIVLDNDGETMLLLSRFTLGYLNERNAAASLWLYDEFAMSAFTPAELAVMEGGSLTEKVGLPAARDIQGFLAPGQERSPLPSTVVKREGGHGTWLLQGGYICRGDQIGQQGYGSDCTVRPAVRVRTDAFLALEPQPEPETKKAEIPRVTFGTDPNHEQPLTWLVLDERDGKMLLLSGDYTFFMQRFMPDNPRDTYMTIVNWTDCSARKYLNGEYLERYFTPAERAAILPTVIRDTPEDGSLTYTETEPETEDRVFWLSLAELRRYLPDPKDRICSREWWLRSKAGSTSYVSVATDGHLAASYVAKTNARPRPAMWVDAAFFAADGE